MKNVLEAGGSSFQKVVKVTIFLRDMADFTPVNQLYATCKSYEVPKPQYIIVLLAQIYSIIFHRFRTEIGWRD